MTNTHINVGGHKITTNKVGEVHTATVVSPFTGNVTWCVTNGLCYVQIWNLSNSYTDGQQRTVATGLPKAKMGGSNCYFDRIFYVFEGSTVLTLECTSAGLSYTSYTYPVADDWVES